MPVEGKPAAAERGKTDESLRAEREETDRALEEGQAAIDAHADMVVRHARENADAVLDAAREKADQVIETEPKAAADARAQEREVEDQVVRDERETADATLRREREDDARALARLLPLERDKTDRFLLTERERSDDAVAVRDDFLGIVSHDLRNLLGGIVMSAGLLGEEDLDDVDHGKKVVAHTSRIQRYAARMNRLIGDLVDVASIDAGKLQMAPLRGHAGLLIAEAVDTFQAAATAKGLTLIGEAGEGALLADFDHDRMLQVLANLMTNAIKFTPAGGRIEARCGRVGADIRFSLGDTGQGIPNSMLDSIFERFWQVGKNDRRGVGLGLYISKCIVEAHGGRIWAESTLGEGTILYFTLTAAG